MNDLSAKENWHEAANLFPLMEQEELDALVTDIRLNGLHNPITLLNGKVLDGRNRALACKLAGITPSVTTFAGSDAIGWVLSQNLQRRNLTSSQRAAIAVEAEELFERLAADAKKRQRLGKQQIADPSLTGQVRDKVAVIFDTNRTYVSDLKKIKAEQPALLPRIKAGTLSVPAAVRLLESETDGNKGALVDVVWEQVSRETRRDHPRSESCVGGQPRTLR
jgi:hypothetical protein